MLAIKSFFQNDVLMQTVFLGNTVFAWLAAIVIFFAALTVLKLFQTVLIMKMKSIAKKTKTDIDDIVIEGIHAIHWPFYVLTAYYFALNFIEIPTLVKQWSFYIFVIAVIYYAIKFLEKLVDFGTRIIIKKREKVENSTEIVKLLSAVVKIGLWVGAVLLILSNLGYNITSIIAGLGIGGIAVALALQNILGDLFSSLTIYFDKPFKIGDFIVLGEQAGTVQKVGIKSTRIQLLQGEELVVPNKELTNAQIRNFGTMEKRRVAFNIGVTYNTSAEKLKMIPQIINDIVNVQENADLDRVNFKEFGDSSLNFEVVFFVNSSDYYEYMNIRENINLEIVKSFEKEKIEFAFPTQTIYLEK